MRQAGEDHGFVCVCCAGHDWMNHEAGDRCFSGPVLCNHDLLVESVVETARRKWTPTHSMMCSPTKDESGAEQRHVE